MQLINKLIKIVTDKLNATYNAYVEPRNKVLKYLVEKANILYGYEHAWHTHFMRQNLRWGRNVTFAASFLLHSVSFILFNSLFIVTTFIQLIPYFVVFSPVLAAMYGVNPLVFAVLFTYRVSLRVTFEFSLKMFGNFINVILADDANQGAILQQLNDKPLVFKIIDSILNIPSRVINSLDSMVSRFLIKRKDAWGLNVVRNLHTAYTVIMTIFASVAAFVAGLMFAARVIPNAYVLDYGNLANVNISPLSLLTSVHVPVNLILGVAASVASSLEYYYTSRIDKFERKLAANSQENVFEEVQAAVLQAIQDNDYLDAMQALKTSYSDYYQEHTSSIPFMTDVLVLQNNKSANFLNGISTVQLAVLDSDNELKTCSISYGICEHPVYVQVHGVRHYYEMASLLMWLSSRNTLPTTNLPVSINEVIYDAEAKQLIDAKVQLARATSVQEAQNAPRGAYSYYLPSFMTSRSNAAANEDEDNVAVPAQTYYRAFLNRFM